MTPDRRPPRTPWLALPSAAFESINDAFIMIQFRGSAVHRWLAAMPHARVMLQGFKRHHAFRKKRLLDGLDVGRLTGAEIGALTSPHVTRDEGAVIYIDHADTPSLRAKYAQHRDVDVTRIVEVDAVWGEHALDQCMAGRKVDYVLASHVIEHVPDVITWLEEIASILKPGGTVRLAIPDRRFTFDYLRRESDLNDWLSAYLVKARAPLPACILDHLLNVCDLDLADAWRGRVVRERLTPLHQAAVAVAAAKDALDNGTYHDVHCWVFTPYSFAAICESASEAGLMHFGCEFFYDTEPGQQEFIVALRPIGDMAARSESWRDMKRTVASMG